MANVSKLLVGAPGNISLLSKLDLLPAETKELTEAQAKVRTTLKAAFGAIALPGAPKIVPKFFTQGSFKYKTLNRGAHMPPQQIDLDEGCYLPMSFAKATRPSHASALFFKAADEALKALADEEEWEYVDDKDTCCRLVVNNRIHIDVPLYAIPDKEFDSLVAFASQRILAEDHAAADALYMNLGLDSWRIIPSDRVLLAHREDDWKPSDPRKIQAWFTAFVDDYTEIARRVCRYLKAWRDNHADLSAVSSLSLMVCVYQAFIGVGRDNIPKRDDEALALVVSKLPEYYSSGSIINPAEKPKPEERPENLIEHLSHRDRQAIATRSKSFSERLNAIIHNTKHAKLALEGMIAEFGDRIPYREDLVSTELPEETVLTTKKTIVAQPYVGPSNSG